MKTLTVKSQLFAACLGLLTAACIPQQASTASTCCGQHSSKRVANLGTVEMSALAPPVQLAQGAATGSPTNNSAAATKLANIKNFLEMFKRDVATGMRTAFSSDPTYAEILERVGDIHELAGSGVGSHLSTDQKLDALKTELLQFRADLEPMDPRIVGAFNTVFARASGETLDTLKRAVDDLERGIGASTTPKRFQDAVMVTLADYRKLLASAEPVEAKLVLLTTSMVIFRNKVTAPPALPPLRDAVLPRADTATGKSFDEVKRIVDDTLKAVVKLSKEPAQDEVVAILQEMKALSETTEMSPTDMLPLLQMGFEQLKARVSIEPAVVDRVILPILNPLLGATMTKWTAVLAEMQASVSGQPPSLVRDDLVNRLREVSEYVAAPPGPFPEKLPEIMDAVLQIRRGFEMPAPTPAFRAAIRPLLENVLRMF